MLIGTFLSMALVAISPDRAPTSNSLLSSNSSFSIYCTSNLDGTGDCTRVDNGSKINCEIVPGSIINCSQSVGPQVQCVLFSSIVNAQAYFSCSPRKDAGINPNRINTDRFSKQSSPALSPDISPDSLTPLPDPFN